MTRSQSHKEKEEHIATKGRSWDKGLWCEWTAVLEDQVQSSMSICSKMEEGESG